MDLRLIRGGAQVFSHKSFSRKSFAPESWAPFTIVLPPAPPPEIVGTGGGAAAGVAGYKLPSALEYESDIRAEIIREDEEILTVIMSAVTSGALKWVH